MEHIFRIPIWNAKSLGRHNLELINFIKFHVLNTIFISATYFTYKNCLRIPNGYVYHTIHPSRNAFDISAGVVSK